MSSLQKIFQLLTEEQKRKSMPIILMVIMMGVLEAAGIFSVVPFLSIVSNPALIETNTVINQAYIFFKQFNINTPDQFLVLIALSSVFIIVLSAFFRTYAIHRVNLFLEKSRNILCSRLFKKFIDQEYSFYIERDTSELSKIVISEVDHIVDRLIRPVLLGIAYAISVLFIMAVLLLIDPLITSIAVTSMGAIYFLIYFVLRRYLDKQGSNVTEALKDRFEAISNPFKAIKTIKLSGKENIYINRLSKPLDSFETSMTGYLISNQAPSFIVEAIIFASILSLALVAILTSGGVYSSTFQDLIPLLGVYSFAAIRIKPALHVIYQGWVGVLYGDSSLDNILNELKLQTINPEDSYSGKEMLIKEKIFLKDISYYYPEAEMPALNGVNIAVKFGSSVGIIGSSGAGKTTLVDIILGLIHPTCGDIVIDGINMQNCNVRQWQKNLGYVPQEIVLSSSSLRENIAFGVETEDIDDDMVYRAAKLAELSSFIDINSRSAFDAQVGDNGIKLSGGQRQRIGIARALYHQPKVLVFDEATSALDLATEKRIMDSILSLRGSHTIFIVTHRIATVRHCDQIYIMDEGAVKARGSFEQLQLSKLDTA
jgi:ATP-binding cassette, subfamily B, bacterial PglK